MEVILCRSEDDESSTLKCSKSTGPLCFHYIFNDETLELMVSFIKYDLYNWQYLEITFQDFLP